MRREKTFVIRREVLSIPISFIFEQKRSKGYGPQIVEPVSKKGLYLLIRLPRLRREHFSVTELVARICKSVEGGDSLDSKLIMNIIFIIEKTQRESSLNFDIHFAI